jgi:hypothetical protein
MTIWLEMRRLDNGANGVAVAFRNQNTRPV